MIRAEAPEDRAGVFDGNRRAFGAEDEARLVDALRSLAEPRISLVAVLEGKVVGHIFFSPVAVDTAPAGFRAFGLAPMAVVPELQRRGIGSKLVAAGLDAVREAGGAAVVVVGHPTFYPRFGFAPASRYGLSCEFPVPDDVFMALELQPGALRGCSGRVRYLPPFSAF